MDNNNINIKLLDEAVERLGMLPGVGKKSAMRLALFLLRQPESKVESLGKALVNLRREIKYCSICNMLSEDDLCPICRDSSRDRSMICVVETIRDVMSIEQTGEYRGLYHLLGGLISPIDGIGPDDLPFNSLVERVSSGEVCEVILAISGGMEGETTSYYINKLLRNTGVRVSAIARGVGYGDHLEYADPMTLGISIRNRTTFGK